MSQPNKHGQSTRSNIKQDKRKKLYLRELSVIVQALAAQEPAVAEVYVTRIEFSADTGICFVYFTSFVPDGLASYEKALEILKLYKGSMRKELARTINARYTPELVFVYDENKEKERRIHGLLDKVLEEELVSVQNPEDSDEE
ncbi:ribosome-binding factor A [Candidatus Dependentiae bacterium]|jgi:ribosome-binding factor A|nr:ribosome-binding factor A [Candidatus Dependentiae bacterium]